MIQSVGARSFASTDKLFENSIPDLMSVEDLARYLRLAPKTIRNYIWRREIPFIKVGKQVLFSAKSIATWLDNKETKPCR